MSLERLRSIAKKSGLSGYTKLNKASLIRLLENFDKKQINRRWWTWGKIGTIFSGVGLIVTLIGLNIGSGRSQKNTLHSQGDNNISSLGDGDISINTGIPIEEHERSLQRLSDLQVELSLTSEAVVDFLEVFDRKGLSDRERRVELRRIGTESREILREIDSLEISDPKIRELKRRAHQLLAESANGDAKAQDFIRELKSIDARFSEKEKSQFHSERSRILDSLQKAVTRTEGLDYPGTIVALDFNEDGKVVTDSEKFIGLGLALALIQNDYENNFEIRIKATHEDFGVEKDKSIISLEIALDANVYNALVGLNLGINNIAMNTMNLGNVNLGNNTTFDYEVTPIFSERVTENEDGTFSFKLKPRVFFGNAPKNIDTPK